MGERLVAFHLAPGHGSFEWDHVFRIARQLEYAHSMCIETPPFDFGPDFTDAAWKGPADDTAALALKPLRKEPHVPA
jgi:sugar phosphate isomerase/epimerase